MTLLYQRVIMRAINAAEVCRKLSISKSTLYRLIQRDGFPPGVAITGYPGRNGQRWLEADVDGWMVKQFEKQGGAK